MRFVFRVDASLVIGTGHVMRCLAVARSLRQCGMRVDFICRDHPGNLISEIREAGYSVVVLPASEPSANVAVRADSIAEDYANWLGVDWETDANQTIAAMSGSRADWLVVDHYGLDARWETSVRRVFNRLMVVDDLANRLHNCDLLIDSTLGRHEQHYKQYVPSQCVILVGPTFAFLRPEFSLIRSSSLSRRRSLGLKCVLISMGGVDRQNATGKVLRALRAANLPQDCRLIVILGDQAPSKTEIVEQAKQMPWKTEVYIGTREMAQLMAASDLVIGAAGGTAWERCCLGVPSIILVIAQNQQASAKALHDHGAARTIENLDQINISLPNEITWMLVPENLAKMSEQASTICDGFGVSRVIKRCILESGLSARHVTTADESLLFRWVNDAAVRQHALDAALIAFDEHQHWFSQRLNNPEKCQIFIVSIQAVSGEIAIGQVRFEHRLNRGWEISYSLDPRYRGFGLGKSLLNCGILEFQMFQSGERLFGQIKPDNIQSRKVFEALGFEGCLDSSQEVMIYEKPSN